MSVGTARRQFLTATLHNCIGLSAGQKGGTGSSQGVFGHNLRKQIFKQALLKRPPNFISPWSSRCFIQSKPEQLTDWIFFFFSWEAKESVWHTDSWCYYTGFPQLEHSFSIPWRAIKISKSREPSVLCREEGMGNCSAFPSCCTVLIPSCLWDQPMLSWELNAYIQCTTFCLFS